VSRAVAKLSPKSGRLFRSRGGLGEEPTPAMDARRDPHRGAPIVTAGPSLAEARGAMILVHGRGASAEGMLGLARALDRPEFTYVAPQAAGNTWYPHSFLAPLEQNEPHLSSALGLLGSVVDRVVEDGMSLERILL